MYSLHPILQSLLLLSLILLPTSFAQLRRGYYKNTCPNVESIVHAAVQAKFRQTFTTAPATLRLFFHDCFVQVCELLKTPLGYNCLIPNLLINST